MPGLLTLLTVACVLVVLLLTVLLVRQALHPPRHTAGYAVAKGLACDPGEIGLPFEEWLVDLADGSQLPVWDISCSKPKSQNQEPITVVIIHGWGNSRIDALMRVGVFLELAQRIILYDLRGHGESTAAISHLGADEEDDLLKLLEELCEESVILVGHSMGAVIAMAAAASDHPITKCIKGVIAYGPYAEFHTSLQGRLRTNNAPTRPITDLAMLWFRAIGLRHRSALECVKHIRCPLLVVHGDEDAVSPVEDGRRIAAIAPEGELLQVEGGNHRDSHEVNEPLHRERICEFISRNCKHVTRVPPTRVGGL